MFKLDLAAEKRAAIDAGITAIAVVGAYAIVGVLGKAKSILHKRRRF